MLFQNSLTQYYKPYIVTENMFFCKGTEELFQQFMNFNP